MKRFSLITQLLCGCPLASELPDIPLASCPEDFGQVQKIFFQRRLNGSALNSSTPTGVGSLELEATWQTLLDASDATKVVISPILEAPETEPGGPVTFGGGNQTRDGIPLIVGREATTFTGAYYRTRQDTIEAIKAYACEDIGVYLIDEFGRYGCLVDNIASPTEAYPIPIVSLFVGDKDLGGFEAPDQNLIQWSFRPNWSDKFYIITPSDHDPFVLAPS
jgi:hypothetical protein